MPQSISPGILEKTKRAPYNLWSPSLVGSIRQAIIPAPMWLLCANALMGAIAGLEPNAQMFKFTSRVFLRLPILVCISVLKLHVMLWHPHSTYGLRSFEHRDGPLMAGEVGVKCHWVSDPKNI